MAWTNPKTWAPNDLVTAAELNLQWRDNLLHLFPRQNNSSGNNTSTTSAGPVLLTSLTLTTVGKNCLLMFSGSFYIGINGASSDIGTLRFYMDGSPVGYTRYINTVNPHATAMTVIVYGAPGAHTFEVYWSRGTAAVISNSGWEFIVAEIA